MSILWRFKRLFFGPSLSALLTPLGRIHRKGWVDTCRLLKDGSRVASVAQNAAGTTLEAELGIRPNSESKPDFKGWEIKAFKHSQSGDGAGHIVTLMTPAPDGGVRAEEGFDRFMEMYGYEDVKGRVGRVNFGGTHYHEEVHKRTGLVLKLVGYDAATGSIDMKDGLLALMDPGAGVAASWKFSTLKEMWVTKHAFTAFVPYERDSETNRVRFLDYVVLGEGTNFRKLLDAIVGEHIRYDPGIKCGEAVETKERHQFRCRRGDLKELYHDVRRVKLMGDPLDKNA